MERKMQITGMTCAACSARVEKAVRSIDGIYDVQVNLLTGTLTYKTKNDNDTALVSDAITKAGYGVKDIIAVSKTGKVKPVGQSVIPLVLSFAFLK